jgi:DNA-binding NtrC family response regulator
VRSAPREDGNLPRVLIVDDHQNCRESLAVGFSLYGWDADTAATAADALRQVEQHSYDWIISDIRMPGMNGLDLVRGLRGRFPHLGLVLLTSYEPAPESRLAAVQLCSGFFIKPVTAETLVDYCGRRNTVMQHDVPASHQDTTKA